MLTTEFLSQIPIFDRLLPKDLETLSTLWSPRTLEPGEVLVRKGEPGSSMFVIEDGIVEIRIPDELQKKEIRVSVLHTGDFFGEISLLDGLPRTATAVAMEETRLLVMRRDDFIEFILQRPSVAVAMLGEIGGRLRATNEIVQSLASKNVNDELEDQLSVGDHLADKIAEFGGSWTFIFTFLAFMSMWMTANVVQVFIHPFDEYPFILLNLMLSTVAALQGPVIMMSQNRAQKKDRLRAELDYQVNLKSELMLQQLHSKMDEVRAAELQSIQETLQVELAIIRTRLEELEPGSGKRPA
jgi:CRP/FNR family transcriptional regulator, cyclic AMP receptor protein